MINRADGGQPFSLPGGPVGELQTHEQGLVGAGARCVGLPQGAAPHFAPKVRRIPRRYEFPNKGLSGAAGEDGIEYPRRLPH